MKGKWKKLIAPLVITLLMILYNIFWFVCLVKFVPMSLWVIILGSAVPLAICGVMLFVTIERIKEIRSGENDDLSQY